MAINIDAIDAQINALVAEQQVNYSSGGKSFNNSDKIRQLMELRRLLADIPDVSLEIVTFDNGIQIDGSDDTQTEVPL